MRRGPGGDAFVLVSWNVRGVAADAVESFIDQMHAEFGAVLTVAQELTKATKRLLPSQVGGHQVLSDTPISGVRVPGFLVHELMADISLPKAAIVASSDALLL